MNRLFGIAIALVSILAMADAQAPTDLRASSPASLQPTITLTWNAPFGTIFFKIFRSSPDTTNFQWIAVSPVRQFEDSLVVAGILYNYAVSAVSLVGSVLVESPRSNIASVRAYKLPDGPKGVIRGIITDQSSGQPLPHIAVRFFKLPSPANRGLQTTTFADGRFEALLDTGSYIIRAEEIATSLAQMGHKSEWYINAAEPSGAKPVSVGLNDTVRVDFALEPAGMKPYAYVSGVVTDEDGVPLVGAVVAFVRPIQELVAGTALESQPPGTGPEAQVIPGLGYSRGVAWYGYTNSSGKYFAQVPTDREYVALATNGGYYPEFFNNAPDPTQATILTIHMDTTGVNFSLRKKTATDTGTMNGVVQDSSGNGVPSRIILFPRPKGNTTSGSPAVFTYTDSTGMFSIQNITSATYSVLAVPFTSCVPSFASATGAGVLSWIDADTIEVTESTPYVTLSVQSIENAGLTSISGRIVDATSNPLAGVRILARAPNGTIAGYGVSDPSGSYVIHALGNGSVTLLVDRFEFSHVQLPVAIPVNTFAIQNVNFVLSPANPTDVTEQAGIPSSPLLMQNYPNPFNPMTSIGYSVGVVGLPAGQAGGQSSVVSSHVRLTVYDVLGREVAVLVDRQQSPGTYMVTWNAAGMASGVYVYRLTTNDNTQCRTMVLLK
jgi:hypothetical protein